MSYLPTPQAVYLLDNSTSSCTLGGIVSNVFQRSINIPCFHSVSQTHIASQSLIQIMARATNDSDTNYVLARIGLSPSGHSSNTQIGASLAHKSSVTMQPIVALTYQDKPTQLISSILDTGDIVTTDNLNILVISCGVVL